MAKFEEGLFRWLAQDPQRATAYLKRASEDEDPGVFFLAMRDVLSANRRMSQVAKAHQLSRTSLYRSLSPNGNPGYRTVRAVLEDLGCRLTVRPI